MPNDNIADLLRELDQQQGNSLSAIEDQLVSIGEPAIEPILADVSAINQRQKRAIDSLNDIPALERRIRILGRIKSPRGMHAILDALADSAIAVADYKRQQDAAQDAWTSSRANNPYTAMMAEDYIDSASSLNAVSIDSLVAYGDDAIPFILKYMDRAPPPVQKALRKAHSRLKGSWWHFWR